MTINGFLKSAICSVLTFAASSIMTSCGNEMTEGESETITKQECILQFEVALDNFKGDNTRSEVREWKNGDRIFLYLADGEGRVSARVVFDSTQNDWNLSYDGIFPSGEYSGTAVFLDGDTQEWTDGMTLGSDVAIYRDLDVTCVKTGTMVKIVTLLRPMVGRLRVLFSDSQILKFAVSGIEHNYKMSLPTLEFSTNETPVECEVGDNLYSKYIYGSFPQTSRFISVGYDNHLFTTQFEKRILEAGVSGYIDLPTEASHKGWEMTILNTPQLGTLDVYDITTFSITLASTVVSNGNGTVSECGFCYSKSDNPTVSDVKVNCGKPTGGTFTKTVTGLEENTLYHVRAYAINESGVAYSEEVSVTTLAITVPSVSATTISVEEGSDSALFSAQIVSEGNGKISECGFCYSTSSMPDIYDKKLVASVSPSFTATASALVIGTRYYVRAYAVNEKGVAYGEQISFIGGGGKPKDEDLPRPNMIKGKH